MLISILLFWMQSVASQTAFPAQTDFPAVNDSPAQIDFSKQPNLPAQSALANSCPCLQTTTRPCSGGPFVDYYYRPPYTGSPPNDTYLPPEDAVPVLIAEFTQIRDDVNVFLEHVKQQKNKPHRALYVKQNFGEVQALLQAIDRAANATISSSEEEEEED